VKELIMYGVEKFGLLPDEHFGARPGRTSVDAVMQLSTTVKEAWRQGKVASALLLDVKGAFPGVDLKMLWHEMLKEGIPRQHVSWLDIRMGGRWTSIVFDDHESELFEVLNGLDQGCPGSPLYWLIYNAGLARLLRKKEKESGVIFVDDFTAVAVGETFEETHEKLEGVMCKDGGVFDWETTHNCSFGIEKFHLVDFTRKKVEITDANGNTIGEKLDCGEPIELGEHTIKPEPAAKLLGIYVDAGLKWDVQIAEVVRKGQEWVDMFRRLSKVKGGASGRAVRQLYTSIAIPRMFYGAEVFLVPQRASKRGGRKVREIAQNIMAKLGSIQRQAGILITGAMRSTASDVIDIHANLLPIRILIDTILLRAAARLGTLGNGHPLAKTAKKSERFRIKKHRGPVDELIQRFGIQPSKMEKILAVRQPPEWTFGGEVIIRDQGEAMQLEREDEAEWKVYTDGSGIDGQVGAAAVIYRDEEEIGIVRRHLGSLTKHEVYDGEGIGLILGMEFIRRQQHCAGNISFYSDSQPALLATTLRKPAPSHYLWDAFHSLCERTRRKHSGIEFSLRWIPGHLDIVGNERADEEAKKAAAGDNTPIKEQTNLIPPRLPYNKSSVIKSGMAKLKQKHILNWTRSPRYAKHRRIDPSTKLNAYHKLTQPLAKTHTSILTQLRTGHVGLNQHLHRIGKAASPTCPLCRRHNETVMHYLLHCPAHEPQRRRLRTAMKRDAGSMSKMLTVRKHLPALFRFVAETERFAQTFPHIPELELTQLEARG
jgi:ribonuclease HI